MALTAVGSSVNVGTGKLQEVRVVLIASWNVNSIRAREAVVLTWLDSRKPDVLCLQETKVADPQFPVGAFETRGYQVVTHGQKSYNGVAIAAKHELTHVSRGFDDGEDEQGARLMGADVCGVRVYSCYVPNGQIVGSPAAEQKIRWLARLRDLVERQTARGEAAALCGDFNVATDDRDVHDPNFWRMQVLYHESMRAALEHFKAAGVVDTFRLHHVEGGEYSWWDYRMLAFPKNRGLRIDYVFASPSLARRCTDASIDREARKGPSPSDHAPVLAHFA